MPLRRTATIVPFVLLAAAMPPWLLPAQQQVLHPNGPLPSFEVATIKSWQPRPIPIGAAPPKKVDPGSGGAPAAQRTDRVHFIGQAVLFIASAYNLPPGHEDRVVGAPDWTGSESSRYEIQAKIDNSLFAAMQTMTPAQQREQVALMEQSLLADRFKLKAHFETREMPVYALVVARGGAKLTPAKDGEASRMFDTRETEHENETTAQAITLDQLAHSVLLFGGRTVVDKTGLQGAYDFTLTWGREQPDPSGPDDPAAAPPVFTAIQEQLGLRLVPSRAPVEVIVIDHIERPSEN